MNIKDISKTKKIVMIIASIISPFLFVAIGLFIPRINYAEGLLHLDNSDPDDLDKILSYSISSPLLLTPAIIIIIVLIVNMSIAGYLISKAENDIEKRFGYLTALAGGLGINTIYLFYKLFKGRVAPATRSKNKYIICSTILAAPLTLVPLLGLAFYKGVDKPTNVGEIKFSTQVNKPNVIEIFTDGFDPKLMEPKLKDDHHLSGFKMLTKYVVSGAETSFSFPTIMGGVEDFNIYKQKDQGATGGMIDLYASIFGNATVRHLMNDIGTTNGDLKRPRYFMNTNSMGKSSSFQESMSGHPSGILDANKEWGILNKTEDANVKPINFGEAKNKVVGKFGSKNYSSEEMYYKFLQGASKIDKNPDTGTRVMMQEFVTHSPRVTGSNGELVLDMGDGSVERATNGLKFSLDQTMDSFKNMKDSNGRSVYDNSMIIVYGDHSNHQNPLAHNPYNTRYDENMNAEKWHSFAMVKYPINGNQTESPVPVVNDHIFYAPYMNNLIKDFYDNQNPNFIDEDSHFQGTNKLLGFFGDEAAYFKFDGDILKVDTSATIKDSTGTQVPTEHGWVVYDKNKFKTDKGMPRIDYKNDINSNGTGQDALLEGVKW